MVGGCVAVNEKFRDMCSQWNYTGDTRQAVSRPLLHEQAGSFNKSSLESNAFYLGEEEALKRDGWWTGPVGRLLFCLALRGSGCYNIYLCVWWCYRNAVVLPVYAWLCWIIVELDSVGVYRRVGRLITFFISAAFHFCFMNNSFFWVGYRYHTSVHLCALVLSQVWVAATTPFCFGLVTPINLVLKYYCNHFLEGPFIPTSERYLILPFMKAGGAFGGIIAVFCSIVSPAKAPAL